MPDGVRQRDAGSARREHHSPFRRFQITAFSWHGCELRPERHRHTAVALRAAASRPRSNDAGRRRDSNLRPADEKSDPAAPARANFISRGADQKPLKWQHSALLPETQLLPNFCSHFLVAALNDALCWSRAEPLYSSEDPQLPSQNGGVPRHTHVFDCPPVIPTGNGETPHTSRALAR